MDLVKTAADTGRTPVAAAFRRPMPARRHCKKEATRELGLDFEGTPGPANAITDVPGALVVYSTLNEGEGELQRGHDCEMCPAWADFHALNGDGEVTGVQWINHAGHFYGPVCLTNTHSVGSAHEAVAGMADRPFR